MVLLSHCLSAASLPVRPISPASEQAVTTRTSTQGGPVNGATTATYIAVFTITTPACPTSYSSQNQGEDCQR